MHEIIYQIRSNNLIYKVKLKSHMSLQDCLFIFNKVVDDSDVWACIEDGFDFVCGQILHRNFFVNSKRPQHILKKNNTSGQQLQTVYKNNYKPANLTNFTLNQIINKVIFWDNKNSQHTKQCLAGFLKIPSAEREPAGHAGAEGGWPGETSQYLISNCWTSAVPFIQICLSLQGRLKNGICSKKLCKLSIVTCFISCCLAIVNRRTSIK